LSLSHTNYLLNKKKASFGVRFLSSKTPKSRLISITLEKKSRSGAVICSPETTMVTFTASAAVRLLKLKQRFFLDGDCRRGSEQMFSSNGFLEEN